jgi:beta-glucosidase-like glycosyl hydrolase
VKKVSMKYSDRPYRQIDLASEAREARIGMTFGEDGDLTLRLVIAYIRGFQGTELGAQEIWSAVPEAGVGSGGARP